MDQISSRVHDTDGALASHPVVRSSSNGSVISGPPWSDSGVGNSLDNPLSCSDVYGASVDSPVKLLGAVSLPQESSSNHHSNHSADLHGKSDARRSLTHVENNPNKSLNNANCVENFNNDCMLTNIHTYGIPSTPEKELLNLSCLNVPGTFITDQNHPAHFCEQSNSLLDINHENDSVGVNNHHCSSVESPQMNNSGHPPLLIEHLSNTSISNTETTSTVENKPKRNESSTSVKSGHTEHSGASDGVTRVSPYNTHTCSDPHHSQRQHATPHHPHPQDHPHPMYHAPPPYYYGSSVWKRPYPVHQHSPMAYYPFVPPYMCQSSCSSHHHQPCMCNASMGYPYANQMQMPDLGVPAYCSPSPVPPPLPPATMIPPPPPPLQPSPVRQPFMTLTSPVPPQPWTQENTNNDGQLLMNANKTNDKMNPRIETVTQEASQESTPNESPLVPPNVVDNLNTGAIASIASPLGYGEVQLPVSSQENSFPGNPSCIPVSCESPTTQLKKLFHSYTSPTIGHDYEEDSESLDSHTDSSLCMDTNTVLQNVSKAVLATENLDNTLGSDDGESNDSDDEEDDEIPDHPENYRLKVPSAPHLTEMSSFNFEKAKRPESLQQAITLYIDFMVEENEKRTSISECLLHPVNCHFEREEYFSYVEKRTIPFPTKQFRWWLQNFNVDIEITDSDGNITSQTVFDSAAKQEKSDEGKPKKSPSKGKLGSNYGRRSVIVDSVGQIVDASTRPLHELKKNFQHVISLDNVTLNMDTEPVQIQDETPVADPMLQQVDNTEMCTATPDLAESVASLGPSLGATIERSPSNTQLLQWLNEQTEKLEDPYPPSQSMLDVPPQNTRSTTDLTTLSDLITSAMSIELDGHNDSLHAMSHDYDIGMMDYSVQNPAQSLGFDDVEISMPPNNDVMSDSTLEYFQQPPAIEKDNQLPSMSQLAMDITNSRHIKQGVDHPTGDIVGMPQELSFQSNFNYTDFETKTTMSNILPPLQRSHPIQTHPESSSVVVRDPQNTQTGRQPAKVNRFLSMANNIKHNAPQTYGGSDNYKLTDPAVHILQLPEDEAKSPQLYVLQGNKLVPGEFCKGESSLTDLNLANDQRHAIRSAMNPISGDDIMNIASQEIFPSQPRSRGRPPKLGNSLSVLRNTRRKKSLGFRYPFPAYGRGRAKFDERSIPFSGQEFGSSSKTFRHRSHRMPRYPKASTINMQALYRPNQVGPTPWRQFVPFPTADQHCPYRMQQFMVGELDGQLYTLNPIQGAVMPQNNIAGGTIPVASVSKVTAQQQVTNAPERILKLTPSGHDVQTNPRIPPKMSRRPLINSVQPQNIGGMNNRSKTYEDVPRPQDDVAKLVLPETFADIEYVQITTDGDATVKAQAAAALQGLSSSADSDPSARKAVQTLHELANQGKISIKQVVDRGCQTVYPGGPQKPTMQGKVSDSLQNIPALLVSSSRRSSLLGKKTVEQQTLSELDTNCGRYGSTYSFPKNNSRNLWNHSGKVNSDVVDTESSVELRMIEEMGHGDEMVKSNPTGTKVLAAYHHGERVKEFPRKNSTSPQPTRTITVKAYYTKAQECQLDSPVDKLSKTHPLDCPNDSSGTVFDTLNKSAEERMSDVKDSETVIQQTCSVPSIETHDDSSKEVVHIADSSFEIISPDLPKDENITENPDPIPGSDGSATNIQLQSESKTSCETNAKPTVVTESHSIDSLCKVSLEFISSPADIFSTDQGTVSFVKSPISLIPAVKTTRRKRKMSQLSDVSSRADTTDDEENPLPPRRVTRSSSSASKGSSRKSLRHSNSLPRSPLIK